MRNQRRLQLATVGLVAVITATGCAPGAGSDAGGAGGGGAMTAPALVPSTSARPTPPRVSATPVPDRAPTVIPVSAFLALPEEMRFGRIRVPVEADRALPRLCGGEFTGGGVRAASAAVMSVYGLAGDPPGSIPHGVLYQTIRTYRGNGSTTFMRHLRTELASCQSFTHEGVPYRIRTATLAGVGDEALTIDVSQPQTDLPGNPVGGTQTNRAVVIRIGDTVTVLWDAEYERSSSKPEVVADFARRAVDAIHAWRR